MIIKLSVKTIKINKFNIFYNLTILDYRKLQYFSSYNCLGIKPMLTFIEFA